MSKPTKVKFYTKGGEKIVFKNPKTKKPKPKKNKVVRAWAVVKSDKVYFDGDFYYIHEDKGIPIVWTGEYGGKVKQVEIKILK